MYIDNQLNGNHKRINRYIVGCKLNRNAMLALLHVELIDT